MPDETPSVWERMHNDLEQQDRVAQEWHPQEGDILLDTLLYTQQINASTAPLP